MGWDKIGEFRFFFSLRVFVFGGLFGFVIFRGWMIFFFLRGGDGNVFLCVY